MKIPSWLEPFLRFGVWVSRAKYTVGVFPICIDSQERVLLIEKRVGAVLGWQLPGGGKNYGVPVEATACHELWEETGLKTTVANLLLVLIQSIEKYRDVNIAYLVTWWTGTVGPHDTFEIKDARWVPIREAEQILLPAHRSMLAAAVKMWWRTGLADVS